MEMLRFATAGSVDDGKSSLIGRLLYDSKSIFEDQLLAVEQASARRGSEGVELALLTDGLRAEREQNITIDVAYRYFNTPKRKFIIADTPGHVQYTRNMVTGTSTADLSVILIDARKGVLPQSKRHAAISSLLRVPEVLVAVNKMDLVDYSEARFREIVADFTHVAERLNLGHVKFVPISALLGDNVVEESENMPWYSGPTFLGYLETVEIPSRVKATGLRMPVQVVVRPSQNYRGLAGEIRSGSIEVGDSVVVLPAGVTSSVKSITHPDGRNAKASCGDPVVVELADDIDASRGDMLVTPGSEPVTTDRFEATICWMGERELQQHSRYILLHTSRKIQAIVESVKAKIDIEDLVERPAGSLAMNDIGRVVIRTTQPLFVDAYSQNPELGSFVLVDEAYYVTVGAGMIESVGEHPDLLEKTSGQVLWISGSTPERRSRIANEMSARFGAVMLDQLALENSLNSDSPSLQEAERRICAIAHLLAGQDRKVVVSAWPPSDESRERLGTHRLEAIHIGGEADGLEAIPESFDDAWLIEAVERRFAEGI
jgi:bifunctional enzyme CysN/CysC